MQGSANTAHLCKLEAQVQPWSGYTLISYNHGGGKQNLDADRRATKNNVVNSILDLFLPNGVPQNLSLDQLTYFVGNYSQLEIPDTINGEPFQLEDFLKTQTSSPVRLYLHTTVKSEEVSLYTSCTLHA